MTTKSNLPKTPFNINSPLGKIDKAKIRSRKGYKKYGVVKDGSSASRKMAQATRLNLYRRKREEKDDPYTLHPMSFEEFDNIPDIGDVIDDEKESK